MARIFDADGGYFYEVDGFAIPLEQSTFHGYQHRKLASKLLDWVGVYDERDGEYFSHWRHDQEEDAFDQMMDLVKQVGTYVLVTEPYDHIQQMFEESHSLTVDDWAQIERLHE